MEKLFYKASLDTLEASKDLFRSGRYRSAVSRAYYAIYQMGAGLCWEHGDNSQFPNGWNNPSHDQLPGLILQNGSLEISVRRKVATILRSLRSAREDADYRPGRTINEAMARTAIEGVERAREVLGIHGDS